MTDLRDREIALENLFSHEQEVESRIKAKAIRNFGLWAASKLGLKDDDANDYSYALVVYKYDHLKQNGKGVEDKVFADFVKNEIKISKFEIQDQLEIFLMKARKEIMGE